MTDQLQQLSGVYSLRLYNVRMLFVNERPEFMKDGIILKAEWSSYVFVFQISIKNRSAN